jgi:hypothetical protein
MSVDGSSIARTELGLADSPIPDSNPILGDQGAEELALQLEALVHVNDQLAVENAAFMAFLQRTAKFSESDLEEEKKGRKSRKKGEAIATVL